MMKPDVVKPDIAYYHYVGGFGLAEAGRTNAIALQWAGYNVARMGANEHGPESKEEINTDVAIHHWHPNYYSDYNKLFTSSHRPKKRIAYWAWECERSYHKGMAAAAHHFDEIWTPSEYCAESFKAFGVPVKIVKHAIKQPHSCKARRRNASFRVLTVFDAWSRLDRKNPIGAIKAFKNAFPQEANVELVIKTLHLNEATHDQTMTSKINELLKLADSDPRVTFVDDYLSEFELQNLFLESDCILSLHRSEGYGLNIARGLAYGIPTVATNYGGCAEWMDYAHKVSWEPCRLDTIDYYPEGSWWAEPNIDDAAAKIKRSYKNGDKAIKQAEKGVKKMDFSFETLSLRMRELLTSGDAIPIGEGIATRGRLDSMPKTIG